MSAQSYPTIRLGEAVERVTKGTTPTTHGYPYTDGGVCFLRVENLQNGVVDTSKVKTFISPEADRFLKRSSLEVGDVLISIAGTIGRTAVVREHDVPANTNQAVAIIRGAAKRFEPVFLRLALESPLLHRHITGEARGGAMQNISLENVRDVIVPVPPLHEQRRIVAEIEKQFTRLEAGVAALRRVQANLKRYRAAVLKAACEGRLVPTEAELCGSGVPPLNPTSTAKPASSKAGSKVSTSPKRQDASSTFESGQQLLARILTERRQNWQGRGQYKEPAAPNTANLPLIPEGWAWAPLEAVSEAVGGFAFSSTKFVNEGYQVVKMANIRMGKIDLTQKPSFISDVTSDIIEKSSLREGDLVVTLTGTRKKRDYGYVAAVKNQDGLLLNQRIARVRPFAGMDSKFLQLAMQTEHYRDRFFSHETGNVGQGNVGMAAVTKEMIAFPPLVEQTRIVAEVERRLSVVEELEAVVTTNLQRATRLRQAVLKNAFSPTT